MAKVKLDAKICFSDGNVTFLKIDSAKRLIKWLDRTDPKWRWFNVIDRKSRRQLYNVTQNNRAQHDL